MTINVTDEYLEKIVKSKITKYMKLIFEYRYDKKICDKFIDSYIKIRYNDYSDIDKEMKENISLRQRILEALRSTQKFLIEEYLEDEKLINDMLMFFYYILYFDGVVYYKNLDDKIEKIYKMREKIFRKNNESFKTELNDLLEEFDKKEEEFLKKFETDEFELKISEYSKKRVYRVNLKANIKFPMIYSETAIKKAFTTGLVREDKLYIEYYLICLKIINDLKKLNFKRQYIVEFADSLLKKDKKIKGILNIINNPAIQDKLSLKIKYEKYLEFSAQIDELIREGYHITVILDDSFKPDYYSVEKLSIFSYVLINENLENYEEIMKYKRSIRNLIEI